MQPNFDQSWRCVNFPSELRPTENLHEGFRWQRAASQERTSFLFSAHYDARQAPPAVVKVIVIADAYDRMVGERSALRYCQMWFFGDDRPYVVVARLHVIPDHHNKR